MYYVRRAFIWLWRWRHSRGFGVQSPTDYRFVRYVINEHWPYYAYEDLQRKYPDMEKADRRLCELFLRLANDVQPDVCLNLLPANVAYAAYVNAGCGKTAIMTLGDEGCLPDVKAGLILCTAEELERYGEERILSMLTPNSLLLLKGIHDNRSSKRVWKRLISADRAIITYDLYDAGILINDNKRYKQNYIINF